MSSEIAMESELLFFDTFSHENTEDLNLDIVQFQNPVVIKEVRIIPLGTQVIADVLGGKRLGATNPSSFRLDLFVNNLAKPNAATFEKIGVFDYKDSENIQLHLEKHVATDGLILKGWYSAVTMAIYGNTTTLMREQSPPPPPPPQPRKQPVTVTQPPQLPPEAVVPPKMMSPPAGIWLQQNPQAAVLPPEFNKAPPIAHLAATLVNALGVSLQKSGRDQPYPDTALAPEQKGPEADQSQVEINARGEAKFPDDRPSDVLFEEYLQKKDMQKRQERERQERHRRSSRSRSKERSYSRGRSPSRSRSGSRSGSRSKSSRSRSRSASGDRVHRSSEKEYRDRQEYRERYRDEGGMEVSRKRDSRDRDTRSSRERRDESNGRTSSRRESGQERKESYDRDRRERSSERAKSPRSRRSSQSPSRERERRDEAYRERGDREKDRGREYYEKDREYYEKDRDYYEKDRDYREKDRDYREHDKDYRELEKNRDYRARETSRSERVEIPDPSREMPRDMPREMPRDMPREMPREMPRDIPREMPRDMPREGWPMPLIKTDVPPPTLPIQLLPVPGGWQAVPQNNAIEIISTRDPMVQTWGSMPGPDWQGQPPPQQQPPPDNWAQQNWARDGNSRQVPINEWITPQQNVFGVNEENASEPGEISEEQQMYGGGEREVPPAETVPLEDMYIGLSDGEIEDADAYSDISSDEEFLDNLETTSEWPLPGDEDMTGVSPFNPYHCEFTYLDTYEDPSLTEYEIEKKKLIGRDSVEEPKEATKILQGIEKFASEVHQDVWVEAVDNLIPLLPVGLSYLVSKTDENVLDFLISWCIEGLDLEKAIAQPLVAYKIRHLKMGIRLAGALLGCDTYVALRLLTLDVQHKLLDVFESPNMSSSMKLAIIKSLDRSIRFKESLEWFVGSHTLQQLKNQGTNSSKQTGYQRLVGIALQKQMARVNSALIPLLRKVHFFEILSDMVGSVERMKENAEVLSRLSVQAVENPRDSEVEAFRVPDLAPDALDRLVNGLQEVLVSLANSDYAMGQPKRVLPSQTVFEMKQTPSNPLPFVLHLLNSCHFLECAFVLLSSPATFHQPGVFQTLKQIFQELLGCPEGLQYLLSSPELINNIIQCLTQSQGSLEEGDENELEAQKRSNPAHLLGLQMILSLQTMQHVDSLQAYHDKVRDGTLEAVLDAAEPLSILHNLSLMTFTAQGRHHVLQVLSMSNHLDVLLPFIRMTGEETQDIKIQRSVCHGYTVQLLLLLVRQSSQLGYLKSYGQQLLAFSKTEPQSTKTVDKVSELYEWLIPLEKAQGFVYESSAIEELVKVLKGYVDEVNDLPKGMVTTLRIMKHLCLPPVSPGGLPLTEQPTELKYPYAQIALFSAECMGAFTTILQKLGERMIRPFQQDMPFTPYHRLIIYETISSALSLMKVILRRIIEVRGSEFQDLTALPCLFNIHTMLCSFAHNGNLGYKVMQIQSDIVEILAAFTLAPEKEQTEEGLAKSLWTQMTKQLLQYILTAPYTYLGGLVLLSELLPIPLPLQTHSPLTEDECRYTVRHRQLWSAHLHSLAPEVHNLLSTLSFAASPPLQQTLRRVAWQLADLGHSSALLVTRSLLDTLVEGMNLAYDKAHPEDAQKVLKDEEETEVEEKVIKEEVACSTETSKVLNLLAFLLNQAPVKMAFAYITSGRTGSNDRKYTKVFERMINLLNVPKDSLVHRQAQEHLMGIVQSLCDLEMTLIPSDTPLTFMEQLSNSLPPSEQMSLVVTGLLQHIDNRDHHFSSVLPALRTLALLMLHDYGFYHVKKCVTKVPTALLNLFISINAVFSKDSSDCIATLSSAIELLQFLVALPEADEEAQSVAFDRSYLISYDELREIVCWDSCTGTHPMEELDNLLVAYAKEEESLRNVHESVSLIISILRSDEKMPGQDITEPPMPSCLNLQALFQDRQTYIISDEEDDRLNPSYWQLTPPGEADLDDDPNDGVRCDLIEMARKYCQDFNLIAELEKGAVMSEPPVVKLRRRTKHGRRAIDTINTSKARNGRGGFVAPMRGRGFGHGMPVSRSDAFRNRAPNTSRPPSMHVDDFIKLELQGSINIGPTGMNPALQDYRDKMYQGSPNQGPNTGLGGGRGTPVSMSYEPRGRGRGGMFYTPPGSYGGRREPMRGGGGMSGGMFGQRGGMMTSRGMMHRGRGGMPGHMVNPAKPLGTSWYGRNQMDTRNFDSRRAVGPGMGRFNPGDDGSGNMNMGRGARGGWDSGWRGRDGRRYMPPPGNPGFYGNRDRGRHQRTFTK